MRNAIRVLLQGLALMLVDIMKAALAAAVIMSPFIIYFWRM